VGYLEDGGGRHSYLRPLLDDKFGGVVTVDVGKPTVVYKLKRLALVVD
jgi:hypothetical protein